LNGVDFSGTAVHQTETCSPGMANHFYAYLQTPSSGTFSIGWSTGTYVDLTLVTVQNSLQSGNPIDVENLTCGTASSKSTSVTTTTGNDFLLAESVFQTAGNFSSFGAGETQVSNGASGALGSKDYWSWKAASASAGSETMTTNLDSSRNIDEAVIAIKPATSNLSGPTNTYTYAGTDYANPHAVTQIANGLSTTTFTYDNNGNVTQKTTDGTTTTYVWDYANRLQGDFTP
jgi:YD repeat-containing protein